MKKFIVATLLAVSLFGGQLGVDGGRFVFGQINEARADQYLIDTQTGQMWRMVKDGEQSTILEPIKIGNFVFNKSTQKMDYFVDYLPVGPYVFATEQKKK